MKRILLVVAMVVAGFTANAQDIKFGAKAGVNFANLNGAEDSNSRTGFHVGAMAEIMIADKFAFQPELMYSTQGATSDKFKGGDADVTLQYDYITVPLMGKYYVVDGFSLEVGPQLGFNINSNINAEVAGNSVDVDRSEDTSSFDFGMNFGLGYTMDNGLNLGARYNLGLTDVQKDRKVGDAVKNGVFQISVGYFF